MAVEELVRNICFLSYSQETDLVLFEHHLNMLTCLKSNIKTRVYQNMMYVSMTKDSSA